MHNYLHSCTVLPGNGVLTMLITAAGDHHSFLLSASPDSSMPLSSPSSSASTGESPSPAVAADPVCWNPNCHLTTQSAGTQISWQRLVQFLCNDLMEPKWRPSPPSFISPLLLYYNGKSIKSALKKREQIQLMLRHEVRTEQRNRDKLEFTQ